MNLSLLHTDHGELNTASNYYEMAIKSFSEEKEEEERSVDDYEDLCELYRNLGVIQRRLNLFDKAMDNLNRSLDLYNEFLVNGGQHDEIHSGILESMAKLYEETENAAMADE